LPQAQADCSTIVAPVPTRPFSPRDIPAAGRYSSRGSLRGGCRSKAPRRRKTRLRAPVDAPRLALADRASVSANGAKERGAARNKPTVNEERLRCAQDGGIHRFLRPAMQSDPVWSTSIAETARCFSKIHDELGSQDRTYRHHAASSYRCESECLQHCQAMFRKRTHVLNSHE
jgi:hypothetical protein